MPNVNVSYIKRPRGLSFGLYRLHIISLSKSLMTLEFGAESKYYIDVAQAPYGNHEDHEYALGIKNNFPNNSSNSERERESGSRNFMGFTSSVCMNLRTCIQKMHKIVYIMHVYIRRPILFVCISYPSLKSRLNMFFQILLAFYLSYFVLPYKNVTRIF